MRIVLFWAITQRIVVIPYRRFRRTYRFHPQVSRILLGFSIIEGFGLLGFEFGTNSCPESSVRNLYYSFRYSQ